MRRRVAVTLLVLGPCVVGAAVVPAPGRVDPRVREIEYQETQVVQLPGYVGYHIHLELAPDETFVALGSGDAAALDVAAEGPHVMLKPKAAQVATNLTLVSSRRVYYFEYRATDAAPPQEAAIYSLRFRYPEPVHEVTPVATPDVATAPVVPRTVNREYWYCGFPSLRPVAASDDGVQTRIEFADRGEWPAIFVRNEDGSESLVNFHAEGTTAVVHRVAPAFVLRRGRLVGCVENRGYAGSGAWVTSGTDEAGTRREVRP